MTAATPSSSLVTVCVGTAASTAGWALAMAKPVPAQARTVRSLGMSPKAMTSVASMPRAAQSTARVPALVTPGALISSSPRPPEWVSCTSSPVPCRAAASSVSASSRSDQASSLVTGASVSQRSAREGTGSSAPTSSDMRSR